MTNKTIIIDAAHKEETRVAVLENGILQDFDREAIAIKQIKGNIYLGKVTRIEPSLQACFIDYGSNRNGFLPFGDIHPDYYNISKEEKAKLEEFYINQNKTDEEISESSLDLKKESEEDRAISTGNYSIEEETGFEKANLHNLHKKYNIKDVITPGQTILVQVTKEERGNKGASMTTYISIAGKYCVLMANTPNKGGVSKKVDNFRDRKILRSILGDLEVSSRGSAIIRTAGVGKKPEEIKRDCDYLNKLWNSIEEASKDSQAPAFIHAEDDVIKRSIRDVYNNQVNSVIVEGKEAYESVKNFIRLTSLTQNNNIHLHEDRLPIFNKYKVEQQVIALYEKEIQLPAGGSIVIDHTEALVAIDVNSGKATKESGVEDTAYNTNLEAAKEIAKQLRLRDLAGLVVIDFIDMYDQKNRRNIERTLRDELQNDRARIQLGRISTFGLLELSRQRLGASFFETITQSCPTCSGTGYIRSPEITAISILRAIRHACFDKQTGVIYIYTDSNTISYMMNYKKNNIIATEKSYNVHIFMHISEENGPTGFKIKKRKSLSEEEKREIEMQVATGKVNQLELEKDYLENSGSDFEESENSRSRYKNNRNRTRGKRNKPNNRKPQDKKKPSFLASLFGSK